MCFAWTLISLQGCFGHHKKKEIVIPRALE